MRASEGLEIDLDRLADLGESLGAAERDHIVRGQPIESGRRDGKARDVTVVLGELAAEQPRTIPASATPAPAYRNPLGIVGEAIAAIARDPEICGSLFELLETQQLVAAEGLSISLIPDNRQLLSELLAARGR